MRSWSHGVMESWSHGVMESWSHGVVIDVFFDVFFDASPLAPGRQIARMSHGKHHSCTQGKMYCKTERNFLSNVLFGGLSPLSMQCSHAVSHRSLSTRMYVRIYVHYLCISTAIQEPPSLQRAGNPLCHTLPLRILILSHFLKEGVLKR